MRLTVSSADNKAVVEVYSSKELPTGCPSEHRGLLEDTPRAVTCRCDFWRIPGSTAKRVDPNDLAAAVTALIDRHWGDRDPATMLPNIKSPAVPGLLLAYTRSLIVTGQYVAVVQIDLDHFKKVNTDHGDVAGNRTLREFADRFRQAFDGLGVVVRTGGEEFSAVLASEDVGSLVKITDTFRLRMASDPLEAIGRTNTCSIGLCIYPNGDRFADAQHHDYILADAREAELRAKHEGRNRTALIDPPRRSLTHPRDG